MAYDVSNPLAGELDLGRAGPAAPVWIALLRVVVGWWFFHAGVTKLLTSGLQFTDGPAYLRGMGDTVLGPLAVWMGTAIPGVIEVAVPLAETLIGLALIAGAVVRLAAVGGAVFMAFFWVGNAAFGHGVVNSDLMGLLLFATLVVFGAGRYYGVDELLERLALVQNHPRLRYLLG
ncbi:DoxX family protein [Haloplanus sp. C73]|uniref:DoxX family protein n=1 Tax=Haloplanus sp. C73 TaxID=3421641 RepID=UPI003EBB3848